ncbi:transglutaminase family protein [Stappia sp. ES.058]|uniref:transglutaminase-like domain-containing protein n=1 Tax=Stappia sp. ES.058 TaxID=1881061 RepID=UPI00087B86E8|nr:transglutaminase family protein [Stappia sp. ES.058]SDU25013.1 Transglutaminase-like enzyme, putative cysteine protease [Stappia sp. ES.058]
MLIRCGYEITLVCQEATALVCLLSIHQERADDICGSETFSTTPSVPTSLYSDPFGSRARRLVAPAGALTLSGNATVKDSGLPDEAFRHAREVPVQDLPDACLTWLTGSRYCETDRLSQIAWDLFGHLPQGWDRVQAICDFVHDHLHFDYLKARATRTAFEAYEERVGVCRDYAHLALSFCRCLNIPARYVNGHLGDIGVPVVDPMDFSAWIEVYLGGGWYTFDPRNNRPRIGRIVIARGRDAADVPLVNSFGPHVLQTFRVWTHEVADQDANS